MFGRITLIILVMGLTLSLAVTSAAAQAATLQGETLTGTGTASPADCPTDVGLTFSYTVSGAAVGPYSGTFTEQGTLKPFFEFDVSIPFSITTAEGTTVTGTKQTIVANSSMTCTATFPNFLSSASLHLAYTATISTPTGNYHDEGTSHLRLDYNPATGIVTLNETYASSLAEPELIAPTSKAQCKNDGWQNYPQFKNQGECVAYVISLTR